MTKKPLNKIIEERQKRSDTITEIIERSHKISGDWLWADIEKDLSREVVREIENKSHPHNY